MKNAFVLNTLVILISLGGAGFCAKLLMEDYDTKVAGNEKDVAGTLKESNTQVKRKLGDNLLWDKINKDSKLYWNDSVQTDEKSQAIITLKDGNEIKLGAASLVSLERDNGQLALSLKSGALLVDNKTGKPSMVSKIKVNGAVIDNSNSKTLALNLDEKNGEVKAVETTADGKGKEITVSKEGKVEEKEIPATLQNPPALFRTWTSENEEKVAFAWTAKQPDTVLEISKDKEFKKIAVKKEVSSGKYETELDPGSYFWRVKVVNPATKEAVYSEERSLEIVQMKKPEPLTPAPKTKAAYRNELPPVEFTWKAADRANNYLLEVAKDKDFKEIILSTETPNTSYQTSKLADGPIYWRVSSIYVNQRQPSSISQFEISKMEINPPTLLDPSHKFVLDYNGFSKNGGLPFKWKADLNETYKFVLSNTEDLKSEVSSTETTQSEILIKDKLKSGTYYWSVGYKNPQGQWTFKEVRRLEVDVLIPTLESPKLLTQKSEFDPDSEKINLNWSSVPGAAKYHFKIVKVDEGTEKVVFEENSSDLGKSQVNLEDGSYKYLVSSIDAAGRESKAAEKSFKVTRSPELEAPDFEMPEVQ